jgi:hypothetical protein
MARKPNMTQAQLDQLREAYEAWNPYAPGAPTAEELAARFGISKNTMYIWRSRGWRLDGREGVGQLGWKDRNGATTADPQAGESDAAIRYLTEELVKARIRIEQLEQRLADLE